MFELVIKRGECLVFLLIYKIFKRGFLHDSKRADNIQSWQMVSADMVLGSHIYSV